MPFKFHFSWIPFIAMLVAVAVGLALGHWQSRRAAEKEAIEANLQARSTAPALAMAEALLSPETREYRQIRVAGSFVSDWPIYLDNRPYQSRPGFYLLMPFKISGSEQAVLVARGWIAREVADRTRLPQTPVPAGEVELVGMVRQHVGRLFEFGQAAPLRAGAIVQNAQIEQVAAAAQLQLAPFVIEQASDTQDGLIRDWPRPSFGADKHRGYAFQWYGLAATAFLFYAVTGFRRGTRQQAN